MFGSPLSDTVRRVGEIRDRRAPARLWGVDGHCRVALHEDDCIESFVLQASGTLQLARAVESPHGGRLRNPVSSGCSWEPRALRWPEPHQTPGLATCSARGRWRRMGENADRGCVPRKPKSPAIVAFRRITRKCAGVSLIEQKLRCVPATQVVDPSDGRRRVTCGPAPRRECVSGTISVGRVVDLLVSQRPPFGGFCLWREADYPHGGSACSPPKRAPAVTHAMSKRTEAGPL